MKTLAVLLVALVVSALSVTAPIAQAAARTSPYRLEGKILEVSKGWLQVEVTKAIQGAGIKVGDKLRIAETSRTRFLQAGKRVAADKLAAGEMVAVEGRMVVGKTPSFTAATVTILK
ncbi:MAG: hypothetical protein QN159_02135 [Armatimonadota bacterium]|nr:hypothetical protein [Armatimonadota bacterium]